jgi:hypothetical protein
MYWMSAGDRRVFRDFPKLADIAPPRQGLATTDNLRFVRWWWEIEPPGFSGKRDKWVPYAKAGRNQRWYEFPRHRVDWEEDGRDIKRAIVERYPYLKDQWQWVAKNTAFYGRAGITYSYLTSGSFSARRLEAGAIFDVAGSSLFPDDPLGVLGILNSSVARRMLGMINPTVNFQVGDLRQLPMPAAFPQSLRDDVARAIQVTKTLDEFDETSCDFRQPAPWDATTEKLLAELSAVELRIDRSVVELYGLEWETALASVPNVNRIDSARRWISFAIGRWLGRWGGAVRDGIARLMPADEKLKVDIRRTLGEFAGEQAAVDIEATVNSLDRFLGCDFIPWHNRLYKNRPVFWAFGKDSIVAVDGFSTNAIRLQKALEEIGATLPDGWERWKDDGIAVNLMPLVCLLSDRKLADWLAEMESSLPLERLACIRTRLGGLARQGLSGRSSVPRRKIPRRAVEPLPGLRIRRR